MCSIDTIIHEAQNLSDQQLREVLAMAKGMDAANRMNQQQGA